MEKTYPNELTTLRSCEMTDQKTLQSQQRYELEKRSRYIQIIYSLVANASVLSSGMGLGMNMVEFNKLSFVTISNKHKRLSCGDD